MPDPHRSGVLPERTYFKKREIRGELLLVSLLRLEGRGMHLEPIRSRALLKGEIHELIVSIQPALGPGSDARDVAYLGFFEVSQAGMSTLGDELWIGGQLRGRLAGYDLTHFPNHLNMVFAAESLQTGQELGLELGDPVVLAGPPD
jgi:hypothetical protein